MHGWIFFSAINNFLCWNTAVTSKTIFAFPSTKTNELWSEKLSQNRGWSKSKIFVIGILSFFYNRILRLLATAETVDALISVGKLTAKWVCGTRLLLLLFFTTKKDSFSNQYYAHFAKIMLITHYFLILHLGRFYSSNAECCSLKPIYGVIVESRQTSK